MRDADPPGTSFRAGAACGAIFAIAAASEMLRLNAATIKPVSAIVLAAVWIAAGAGAGAALGALGGRGWRALRLVPADGAVFLATIGVGHLLLPLGYGPVLALLLLAGRLLRRALLPRHRRLDAFGLLVLAVGTVEVLAPDPGALPPPFPAAMPPGTPAPGAMSVTLTIHPPGAFPEVAARHVRLAPLDADAPGREAALATGRLPLRTRSGPSHPRAVPGGGGVAKVPACPGSRALVRLFPRVTALEGTVFAPRGTLAEVARAAGIPVLRDWPAASDPPLFLRTMTLPAPPDLEQARALLAGGAWFDVEWAPDGGELALAGPGFGAVAPDAEVSALDVAPTVLHLLGLAVPRECDGRVLVEFLDPDGPGARPVRYRPLAPAGRSTGADSAVSPATTSR